jgi:hypothetical protein
MLGRGATLLAIPLLGLAAVLTLVVTGVALRDATAGPAATASGIVVDEDGIPVAGAVVRQQTTLNTTTSDADGRFLLGGLPEGITVTVTAWDEGFHPGGAAIIAPAAGITITLKDHPTTDNPDYGWLTSMPSPTETLGCGHCMVAYPQWEEDAHSQSGVSPRFFSLYNGTDITGTMVVTPGYKTDFPGTAGNCATCHAPGAAANEPFSTDMNTLVGVEREGIFCDFCHKIGAVYLDPATGRPYPNAPGVVSYRLYRPPPETHMFWGTFDDVLRRVAYLELEKQSQFCAPCHQFSFWGTPIYQSFREWQESPYPAEGVECQSCHMEYEAPATPYFVLPEKGGLNREQQFISNHRQPGAADEELLQNTVTMALDARQTGIWLEAGLTITNTDAGHHVPTDHPSRHMILTVTAVDAEGRELALLDGPRVPAWGGDQAGLPGKAYAKVLQDVATGEWPVSNYWKQTSILSDTRLAARAADPSDYRFRCPPSGGPITVTAELRFRRLYQAELDARGWKTPDVVMERSEVTVATEPVPVLYLPLLQR